MHEQQLHDAIAAYNGKVSPESTRLYKEAVKRFADSCGWSGGRQVSPGELGSFTGVRGHTELNMLLRYPECDHRIPF